VPSGSRPSSARYVRCVIDRPLRTPRTRALLTLLMTMVGLPFAVEDDGPPDERVAAVVRVTGEAGGGAPTPAALHLAPPERWEDPRQVSLSWDGSLPLLFGRATHDTSRFVEDGRVRVDVLGALEFFTAGERRAVAHRDGLGRFRPEYSVLDDLGLAYIAPISRYGTAIRAWLRERADGLPEAGWRGRGRFLVALTHDVDSVREDAPSLRKARHLLVTGLRARRVAAVQAGLTEVARQVVRRPRDPAFNFDAWAALERRLDVRATYHFFGDYEDGRHPDDAWYAYGERGRLGGRAQTLAEAIRTLADDGFEIGLHASIASHGDAARGAREAATLGRASGGAPRSVRAHHLRFDEDVSVPAYAAAGLRTDSSIGGMGFARGVACPFPVAAQGSASELLEVPTVAMDHIFDKEWRMGLDHGLATRKVCRVLGEVRDAGGAAAILFHPDVAARLPLYEAIVGWIREQGGECTTVADLAARWADRGPLESA